MTDSMLPEPGILNQLKEEVDGVSEETLNSFLIHIGNRPCEACGADKWFVVADTKVSLWDAYDQDGKVPVLNVCCGKCGNIRSFVWARVKFFINHEIKNDGS